MSKYKKSGSYYHFIGGVANHFKEQTIHDYGLRIGDFTFEQWFKEFKEMYLGNDIPAESFSNNKIISKNNSDTKHPDMKYMKEALNEVAMNKDNVHEFIKFAKNALQLKEKVSVKLLEKRHENMTPLAMTQTQMRFPYIQRAEHTQMFVEALHTN